MRKLLLLMFILNLIGKNADAQTTSLAIATVSAPLSGQSVTVPITVQNFSNVGAISLVISYNATILTFTGLANQPSGMLGNASGGNINISWFSTTPFTIANGGKLVDLQFTYDGGMSSGQSTPLSFVTSSCEIANASGTVIPVTYQNGAVTGPTQQPVLSVMPDNRDVASTTVGTTTFTVVNTGTGTMNWTAAVTSGSDWLSITSGSSGTNSGTITVSYTANMGATSRQGKITVTATGATGSPKQVTVTQSSGVVVDLVLSVTPDSRDVSSTAGTTTFAVANAGGGTMNWTAAVTTGTDWLSITSGSSGTNSGTIALAYTANTSTTARQGTVTVTAAALGSPKQVTVRQQPAGVAGTTLTIGTVSAPSSGQSVTVPITVQNFSNVGAISLVISYNATILTFTGLANQPSGMLGNASGGNINISWFSTNPLTLSNGAKLLDLQFTYNGGLVSGQTTPLTFVTASCEVANASGNSIPVTYQDGAVTGSGDCIPVSLPSDTSASPNTVEIPIVVGNLTGKAIASFEFTVTFRSSILTAIGPIIAGTLSSSFTVASNTATAGEIRIAAAGSTALTGNGALIKLKFSVANISSPDSTDLTFTKFRFNDGTPCATTSNGKFRVRTGNRKPSFGNILRDTTIRDGQMLFYTYTGSDPDGDAVSFSLIEGPPGLILTSTGMLTWTPTFAQAGRSHAVGVRITDGNLNDSTSAIVTVNRSIRRGDANLNGVISPGDAARVLEFVVGLFRPSLADSAKFYFAADANANGLVTALDAARILLFLADSIANPIPTFSTKRVEQEAGYHQIEWQSNVASGVYFYRIEATALDNSSRGFVETKKMLLLR